MVGALLSLMLNFMTMGIHVVSKSSPAIRWVTSGSHPSWRRMLGVGALSNSVNNTAALQSTPNTALGINANSPSPFAGLNSVYGPWIQPIDLG